MSEVVGAIEDSFKKLVVAKPYRSISVKLVCERAGITRKAFYQKLGGKRDALRAEYVAAYFADAKAQMMRRWIADNFPLPAGDMADLYSEMALPFWVTA